jgi:hypothetical protein
MVGAKEEAVSNKSLICGRKIDWLWNGDPERLKTRGAGPIPETEMVQLFYANGYRS